MLYRTKGTGALPPFFFQKYYRAGCLALLLPILAVAQPVAERSAGVNNAADQEPSPARVKQLVHLVRQDCGACHGLTLKGGLGPALTAETLHDKAADSLTATILSGRNGTPMPPFRGIVSDSEAAWIVRQLQAGFPSL